MKAEPSPVWIVILELFTIGFLAGYIFSNSKNADVIEVIDQDNSITTMKVYEDTLYDRDDLDGAGGRYFGNGRIVCLPNKYYCQHEVGHAIDDFYEYPSESKEFKKAIELHLKYCIAEEPEEVFCEMITNFPGVNGNPFHEIVFDNGGKEDWGGYGELYASVFELSHRLLIHMPASLDIFFNPNWRELKNYK